MKYTWEKDMKKLTSCGFDFSANGVSLALTACQLMSAHGFSKEDAMELTERLESVPLPLTIDEKYIAADEIITDKRIDTNTFRALTGDELRSLLAKYASRQFEAIMEQLDLGAEATGDGNQRIRLTWYACPQCKKQMLVRYKAHRESSGYVPDGIGYVTPRCVCGNAPQPELLPDLEGVSYQDWLALLQEH